MSARLPTRFEQLAQQRKAQIEEKKKQEALAEAKLLAEEEEALRLAASRQEEEERVAQQEQERRTEEALEAETEAALALQAAQDADLALGQIEAQAQATEERKLEEKLREDTEFARTSALRFAAEESRTPSEQELEREFLSRATAPIAGPDKQLIASVLKVFNPELKTSAEFEQEIRKLEQFMAKKKSRLEQHVRTAEAERPSGNVRHKLDKPIAALEVLLEEKQIELEALKAQAAQLEETEKEMEAKIATEASESNWLSLDFRPILSILRRWVAEFKKELNKLFATYYDLFVSVMGTTWKFLNAEVLAPFQKFVEGSWEKFKAAGATIVDWTKSSLGYVYGMLSSAGSVLSEQAFKVIAKAYGLTPSSGSLKQLWERTKSAGALAWNGAKFLGRAASQISYFASSNLLRVGSCTLVLVNKVWQKVKGPIASAMLYVSKLYFDLALNNPTLLKYIMSWVFEWRDSVCEYVSDTLWERTYITEEQTLVQEAKNAWTSLQNLGSSIGTAMDYGKLAVLEASSKFLKSGWLSSAAQVLGSTMGGVAQAGLGILVGPLATLGSLLTSGLQFIFTNGALLAGSTLGTAMDIELKKATLADQWQYWKDFFNLGTCLYARQTVIPVTPSGVFDYLGLGSSGPAPEPKTARYLAIERRLARLAVKKEYFDNWYKEIVGKPDPAAEGQRIEALRLLRLWKDDLCDMVAGKSLVQSHPEGMLRLDNTNPYLPAEFAKQLFTTAQKTLRAQALIEISNDGGSDSIAVGDKKYGPMPALYMNVDRAFLGGTSVNLFEVLADLNLPPPHLPSFETLNPRLLQLWRTNQFSVDVPIEQLDKEALNTILANLEVAIAKNEGLLVEERKKDLNRLMEAAKSFSATDWLPSLPSVGDLTARLLGGETEVQASERQIQLVTEKIAKNKEVLRSVRIQKDALQFNLDEVTEKLRGGFFGFLTGPSAEDTSKLAEQQQNIARQINDLYVRELEIAKAVLENEEKLQALVETKKTEAEKRLSAQESTPLTSQVPCDPLPPSEQVPIEQLPAHFGDLLAVWEFELEEIEQLQAKLFASLKEDYRDALGKAGNLALKNIPPLPDWESIQSVPVDAQKLLRKYQRLDLRPNYTWGLAGGQGDTNLWDQFLSRSRTLSDFDKQIREAVGRYKEASTRAQSLYYEWIDIYEALSVQGGSSGAAKAGYFDNELCRLQRRLKEAEAEAAKIAPNWNFAKERSKDWLLYPSESS